MLYLNLTKECETMKARELKELLNLVSDDADVVMTDTSYCNPIEFKVSGGDATVDEHGRDWLYLAIGPCVGPVPVVMLNQLSV
jgi:hypothetical protein